MLVCSELFTAKPASWLSVTSRQPMKFTNTCGSRRSRSDSRNAVATTFFVHALLHASVSILLPSSHCSVPSTTPLPHTGLQSLSLFALAPAGQQPSPFLGSVIAVNVHA